MIADLKLVPEREIEYAPVDGAAVARYAAAANALHIFGSADDIEKAAKAVASIAAKAMVRRSK